MRRACFVIAALLSAQATAAGRSAAYLGQDARGEGLGGLLAVQQEGPLSLGGNPAALASMRGASAAFTHQAWLAGSHAEDLAYGQPLGSGAWAARLGWFGTDPFDNTGGLKAAVDHQFLSLAAGWGGSMTQSLRTGASLGWQRQSLASRTQQDLAVGAGLEWQSPWRPLSVGANLRQAGWALGAGEGPGGDWAAGLALDWSALGLGWELHAPLEGAPLRWRGGAEWRIHPALALRLGSNSSNGPDQSLAPVFGLRLAWAGLSLDWALAERGALGSTQAVTLRWDFGAFSEETAPARPMALLAQPDGPRVHLSWDSGASAASGYDLYVGLAPDAPMRRVNAEPLSAPTYVADLGQMGLTYYFKAVALDAQGQVLVESEVTAVTLKRRP